MGQRRNSFLKNYGFSLLLIGFIVAGSVLGAVLGNAAVVLKPLGDIFLNLLFTAVVPLVFFSIASAVARMGSAQRLQKILGWMFLIFIVTGAVASVLMMVGVQLYPPAKGVVVAMPAPQASEQIPLAGQVVGAFTVSDFGELLSRRHMLALIVFSMLVGLAAARVGTDARPFIDFLSSGNAVMTRFIGYVMWYAPVGLGAYFAYLVGTLGAQILESYVRVITLYYPVALGYFFVAFSFYVFWARGKDGLRIFWPNIVPPALTAWATGSSVAAIPVNMEAAERMRTPRDIYEVVIPIGATIHMEGSCIAAIVKIAFLFGVFGMPFAGGTVFLKAVFVAILCGTVISGIPAGGMLGEMLIITMYGFPVEALPLITMIGTLVDPPATMINAVGDNVAGMMVEKILDRKLMPKR